MANTENINKVIASIKGEIEATKNIGFNMNWPIFESASDLDRTNRSCGTVACIAGHAAIVSLEGERPAFSWDSIDIGREYLELTSGEASELFYADEYLSEDESGDELQNITPEHAIRTLELLRDEGVIDWKRTENV